MKIQDKIIKCYQNVFVLEKYGFLFDSIFV